MSRRKLRPDEIDLWRKVAASTQKLQKDRPGVAEILPKPKPAKPIRPRASEFEIGQKASQQSPGHNLAPGLSERLSRAPVQMDRKAFGKLKRGKLVPEAKIDLHGMTLDQAHPALSKFIMRAHASEKRLVLVITGKGKTGNDDGPIPVRRGILRHHVPQWMASPPLAQVILQVAEAHVKHGGGGAYYVYLRRHR